MTQQTEVLERELRIAARPETVFGFFVEPAKLMRWMGKQATLDPRPGGICRIDINGYTARGEYVEVTPHSRIVFTWGWETEGSTPRPGESTVEVTLTPDGDGTLVRLRHIGLNAEERANHGLGWDQFLPRLAECVEEPGLGANSSAMPAKS
jgi:uncharacterized protein YndB with AHSA1/START domain